MRAIALAILAFAFAYIAFKEVGFGKPEFADTAAFAFYVTLAACVVCVVLGL